MYTLTCFFFGHDTRKPVLGLLTNFAAQPLKIARGLKLGCRKNRDGPIYVVKIQTDKLCTVVKIQ